MTTVIGVLHDTIANNEEWMESAACAQTDPDSFFLDRGGSPREAKGVCAACPVASQCLDYALRNDERWGIWGGLTEYERRGLKRRRQLADRAKCGTEAGLSLHYKHGEPSCERCRAAAAERSRRQRAERPK